MPPGESVGDDIGPYRLLAVLGEGGFGVVYLAERREPFVQRVALKVIKPGMDTAAVLARFDLERRALGLLDHPHIARIFDAGTTPTGRPYFVMEHVGGPAGCTLTQFASRHGLSLRARVELFVPVCEAVQHAHEHGLIHRDLKPQNILVAEADGRAVPKVIDFGIARALWGPVEGRPGVTAPGTAAGTPEYMSPEQAAGESAGPSSDVHALGVTLYELVTGRLPRDTSTVRGLPELHRLLLATDPRAPSAHEPSARGDLDTIVLRALAVEPERRYASPAAMADDLRRYLDSRPIEAERDNPWYVLRTRARRVAVRSPLLAGLVAVVLAFAVTEWGVIPMVARTGWLGGWFGPVLAAMPWNAPVDLDHVRVITLTDDIKPRALCELAGVPVERLPDGGVSLRPVHGVLASRLAACGAKAVAWDIAFEGPTDLDEDLVKGLRALDGALPRVEWFVAAGGWSLDPAVPGVISPAIVVAGGASRIGGNGAATASDGLHVHLAAQRPGLRAVPSLALLVAGAIEHPGWAMELEVSTTRDEMSVAYVPPSGSGATGTVVRDHPLAAEVVAWPEADADVHLAKDDRVVMAVARVADDRVLQRATLPLERVLAMDEAALRREFEGRAVLVGDAREGRDIHELGNGREGPAVYAIAASVEQILHNRMPWRPSDGAMGLIQALVCGAGVLGGVRTAPSLWKSVAVLLGLAVVLVGAGVGANGLWQTLLDPGVGLPALGLSVALGHVSGRLSASPGAGRSGAGT